MPRWLWRAAADILVSLHLAYFAVILVSSLLPLPLQILMILVVLLGLAANGGKCWVTQLEYRCRRRAEPDRNIRAQSLIRRLARWTTGLAISERQAGGINLLVLAAVVAARFLVM